MDVYDAIALTVSSHDGKIKGRTAIQKLMYFNTIKISSLNSIRYSHYFYGPFSREVASALEDMSAFSYLNEIVYSGFHDSYLYQLTNTGRKYSEKVKKQNSQVYEKINETVKICDEFCGLQPAPLSFAAKSYYILTSTKAGKKGMYTVDDVRNIAKDFDWDISNKDIEIGVSLLQKLNLVSVS